MKVRHIMRSTAAALALSIVATGLPVQAMGQVATSTRLDALTDAVAGGDIPAVGALLEGGADPSTLQVDGSTALHWAIYRDDPEMVDLLVRSGADVDVANREGLTPIAMASMNGSAAIIRSLLDAGADASTPGSNGVTTVMLAARSGNPDSIRMLAASGVDINAKEDARETNALMWAAEQGHEDVLSALIGAGADVGMRSSLTRLPRPYIGSPFDVPTGGAGDLRPPPEPVPAPTAGETPQPAPPPVAPVARGGGLTALAFAAREGHIESARVLIDEGSADVNQLTEDGWSPLLIATQNRHYRLARFLLDHGANVNSSNIHGWTPLYLATDNRNIEDGDYPVPKPDIDHLEYIRLLLDRGAGVDGQVAHGRWGSHTTLTRTIFTMQWFYEEGATPFIRAAQSADLLLMRLFLEAGADPLIETDWGDTALLAAAGIGWVEGVTRDWSRAQSLEVVQLLLDLGLDPNAANRDFRTPLMAAAHKGNPEIIELLVEAGARLETRDRGSRDTHKVDLSGRGGWQAVDYAEGLVRVGVQSALVHPEAAALLRSLMTEAGLEVPPLDRTLGYVCAVEGELCQNP
jgi:ankyrin repeat protein